MSIALDAQCIACHIRRHLNTALTLGDGDTATRFIKELMKLYIAAPEHVSMTFLGPQVDALYRQFYDVGEDRFAKEKADSNRFVMERFETIQKRAETAADPVLAGLKLAILGNYIDFSALQGEVSFEKLEEMGIEAFYNLFVESYEEYYGMYIRSLINVYDDIFHKKGAEADRVRNEAVMSIAAVACANAGKLTCETADIVISQAEEARKKEKK